VARPVAAPAVDAGAAIINHVSGRADLEMARLARQTERAS
jgi:hypothetical protein